MTVAASRTHVAALRLNELVAQSLGTAPLMSDFYSGAAPFQGGWSEVAEEFAVILTEIGTPRTMDERVLHGIASAYELQARVGAGEQVSWRDQVRTYIQADPVHIPPARLNELREALGRSLEAAGYPGDLLAASERWNEDRRVPAGQFAEAAGDLLSEARLRTEERLGPLPEGTDIELIVVRNVFYNGYNEYLGDFRGECRLNADFHWSYPQLRHTVAHEAFPGHHAISAIREQLAREDKLPRAAGLYFARTPLTPIIEGTCEIANELLGWDWDEHDEIYSNLNRLRKAVMTNVAIDVNHDGMPREDAVRMLRAEALGDTNWAEARYEFLTHPLWKTSFPHYWFGTETVRAGWESLNAAGLSDRLPEITHHYPHTVETFQLAVAEIVGDMPTVEP